MYIPRANEEKRLPVLHQLIRDEPLAALITLNSGGLFASHIPMVLDAEGSALGVLRGHVSRANTHWTDIDSGVEALAIFSGPQHYITPTWYPSKLEDGKDVPTWNYVVVQAYGPIQVIHDAEWMLRHLKELTDESEAGRAAPWKVSDAPEEFIRQMMNGIVGFEMEIRRIEGKWKVSQNRTAQDKRGVVEGLTELGTAESLAMKDLVVERS
jgi:transcriptional regulator